MSRSEDRGQKLEVRSQGTKNIVLFVACCLSSFLFFLSSAASAQDDMLKIIETKRIELKEKEDQLKREEQRLNTLKKAVDEKIETYTKLLSQVEATIKKVEQVKGEKLENVVKAYEAMPPEDAAARLSVLDDVTALLIMSRMKSKKAGAIIALMEPRKAAAITKSMTTLPLVNPEK